MPRDSERRKSINRSLKPTAFPHSIASASSVAPSLPSPLRRSSRILGQPSSEGNGRRRNNSAMAEIAHRTIDQPYAHACVLNSDLTSDRLRRHNRRLRQPNEQDPIGPPAPSRLPGQLHRDSYHAHPNNAILPTRRFSLDVAVQPPQYAHPGIVLSPTIVVRLRLLNQDGTIHEPVDLSKLFAVVSLLSWSERASPSSVRSGILNGKRLSDSAHSLAPGSPLQDGNTQNPVIGYFSFPDLVINARGTFQLRVTLVRVGNMGRGSRPIASGGSNIQTVSSNPVILP